MAQYSYNGWLASANPADFGGLSALVVAGETFAPGVRTGDVFTVLQYVAQQLHARVEPVIAPGWHQADDWGYAYRANRNANNISCHGSGTAIDYNATRHPNNKSGTFNKTQVSEIRKILSEVGLVVRWGGDFSGTKDEMHFEIHGNAAQVAGVAARLRQPTSSKAMSLGSTGPLVSKLQSFLNAMFPSYSRLSVDGDFGPATESVVKEFQRRLGLDVDGVVGPKTEAAMRSFGWK